MRVYIGCGVIFPRCPLVFNRGPEADAPFHFGWLSDRDLNERRETSFQIF